MRYFLILTLSLVVACSPNQEDPVDAGGGADAGEVDLLSGTYNVETVTCNGVEEAISVVATVTFDGTSYLEEWAFPAGDCEFSLAGTVASTDEEVTLEDVVVTCVGGCPPQICEADCSFDQVYQYARDGEELLLSFTQQGDENACGPCGEGVASTYLLVGEAAQ